MGLERLAGVHPGRFGVFLGSLAAQPAAVERALVAEMEQLGYGTLWYGESVGREAFAHGAILLSATNRLVVGSGIANIWARDPQAMATGARALAEAWPDRFILGIGVSHAPMVERRGHRYERPVSAISDYLDGMSNATWRGPDASMPPIVLAALGPRMVALAAERTAGDYTYFTTAEHVKRIRAEMGQEPFIAADLPVLLAVTAPARVRSVTGIRRSISRPRITATICCVWVGRQTSSSRPGPTGCSTPSSPGASLVVCAKRLTRCLPPAPIRWR